MAYLLGLIGALIGGLIFYKTKAQSAGSLLENAKTKEEINKHDSTIAGNAGRISAEQERINDVQTSSKKELEKVTSNEDLVGFFNSINKRK